MSNQPLPGVVVHTAHRSVGDMPDYHVLWFAGPLKADKRGHPNPRMQSANWQFWRCNNPDCPGQFFVSNDVIKSLIVDAELAMDTAP